MIYRNHRSSSLVNAKSSRGGIQSLDDNSDYQYLPNNGLKFNTNIKTVNFKCSQCNNDIGKIDKLTRHYVDTHPRYITDDLFGYVSNYNYLLAIAKVQINMLINKKYKP